MAERKSEKPQIFQREGVLQKLDQMMKKQIVFITAPMGYGKTTIVREYLKEHHYDVVNWFYFGKNADEEQVFVRQMANVFAQNGNKRAQEMEHTYAKVSYYELETYTRMLKLAITKETVCIFDDYHLCHLKYMNKLIEIVASMEIPHFHLIVIGRYYPEIPYLEMQMKGQCELLEKKDLCLSEEETERFFLENHCKLTREELDEVVSYTDGWMAAIYLLCTNYLQDGRFHGTRSVANLIRTSIFQRLNEEEQQILLSISMLDSCTPEQVNYVMNQENAAAILFDLERKVGFLQYTEENGFILHSMLRSVLQEEVARRGIGKKEFLQKNVDWYLQQKDFLSAITLLDQLECYEEIFEILKQGPIAIYLECLGVLYDIFYRRPREFRVAYCEQYLIFISCCIIRGNAKEALEFYSEIQEEMDQLAEQTDNEMSLCQIAMLRMVYFYNNLEQMVEKSLPLLNRMGEETRKLYWQEMKRLFSVPNMLRVLHYKWGNLRDGLKQALDYMKPLKQNMLVELSKEYSVFQAEYLYETGRWEEAELVAQKELQRAYHSKDAILAITAYQILLYVSIFKGNREGVEAYQKEVETWMKEYPESMIRQDGNLLLTDIYSVLHQEEQALDALQEINGRNYIVETSGALQYVYAKLMCCKKNYQELEFVAQDILETKGRANILYKQIYGIMYLAIAHYYQGREEEAVALLEKLLAQCAQDDIVMIFAENATELLPILSRVEKTPFVNKVKKVCAFCGKQIEQMRQHDGKEEKAILTDRECEVMNLVEQGKKNAEIAQELHIAQITVEKTLSNIYRKLGVKNRAAALVKYQKLKA